MFRTFIALAVSVLVVLSFTACGGGSASTPPSPQPAPVAITISPATVTALVGTTVRFSANVTGSANKTVSYSLLEGGAGGVTANGVYTAPATAGIFRVRVISAADPTKFADALITVHDYDGTFTRMQDLPDGYDYHTASLLPDGSVLVVGGYDGFTSVHRQAIRYDPAVNAFLADATLATPRMAHASATLSSGKIIIMGGYDPRISGADFDPVFTSTEIYDATTKTFNSGPDMMVPRRSHVASSLSDGKILVTGGIPYIGRFVAALQATEIYDPSMNQFTRGNLMTQPRSLHTATLLKDGRVLIVGGRTDDCTRACSTPPLKTAEIFDPVTGEFSDTGAPLNIGRYNHTATMLGDGRVLIVGGENNQDPRTGGDLVMATELYDPLTGVFTLGPNLLLGHSSHTATMLNNGTVLLAGGHYVSGAGTARTEIFDPATGTSIEGPLMWDYHVRGTATKLLNGEVLVVGGSIGTQATPIVERFR